MDSAQTLALLFVFATNALVVGGLAWVIYHIHQVTDQLQSQMTVATQDLVETGRGLRGLAGGVDRVIERLASAERQSTAMLRATADTLSAMDGQLRLSLQTTLAELAASGELGDTQLQEDVRRLIASLDQSQPGATNEWAERHRQELEQVMAQSEVLMQENERLVGRVGDMREQLAGLEAVQRAQQAADREIASLQSALSQQQQLAARLRQEAREAGHRLGAAEADAQRARTDSELARDDAERQAQQAREAAARAQALDDELAALRLAHQRLETDHAKQRDQLQRLMVEKDFIEDKFLNLDADSPETAGT